MIKRSKKPLIVKQKAKEILTGIQRGFSISYKKLLKIKNKKGKEYFASGKRLYGLKEYDTALQDLKNALLYCKSKAPVSKLIAEIYRKQNEVHHEINYLLKTVHYEKSVSANIIFGKRILELRNGKIPITTRFLKTVTQPNSFVKEAQYYFKKAHALNTKDPEPLYLLGYTHVLLKNTKEAIRYFDQVLLHDKKYPNLFECDLFSRMKEEK
jgi:tetratricopeptide (TPR) repeat protein